MSTDEPTVDWLQLLSDEADWSVMTAARSRVLAHGDHPEHARRDADAAFDVRRRLDQRRQRAAESSALNDIAVQLTTVRDSRVLLQRVVEHARALLGVDLAYAGTVDGPDFVIHVTSGALTQQLLMRFPRTEGLAGMILATRAPAWTLDYRSEPAFLHMTGADSAAAAENMRGLLGVPLQVGDQVLGALFACKRTERRFSEAEIVLLSALAAHAAVAIDNARSFEGHQRAVAEMETANRDLSVRTEQLERAMQWDRALTDVVLRGGGVRQLVDDVTRLMGRPAYLVITGSPVPTELDPVRDVVRELIQGFVDHPRSRRHPVSREHDGVHVEAHCVHADDLVLGALVVCTGAPAALTESDALLLGRAAPAVALLLATDHYAEEASRRSRDAFVVDLITHPAATPHDDARQCRLAGLDPELDYCVAVSEVPESGAAARRAVESLDLGSDFVVAQHGSRVIAVVQTDGPDGVVEALMTGKPGPTVGVAGPARGAAGLSATYLEAQQTCDVLVTLGRRGDVSTSTQLGIYGVLLSHTGRNQLERMTQRLLGPLRTEEDKRGTPLVATLSAYLGSGRRHAETAAGLNIHVNTLYQRLESIDRLIGTEWRTPDAALDLQVVLRLERSAMLTRGH